MRKQCECKLPYVHDGTDTCIVCGNQQDMFLQIIEQKPLSFRRTFNGSEFQKGDIVEVIAASYSCLVEIRYYIYQGWYRVKLPNGGFHDTQILGNKITNK